MKNFICKHKKLLMVCLFALLVSSLCFGTLMTASAFKITESITCTYKSSQAQQVQGAVLTSSSMDTISVGGQQSVMGISINGQVYGTTSTASSMTVNSLTISSIYPTQGVGDQYDQVTYLYYRQAGTSNDWTAVDCSPSATTSSKISAYPLKITTAGTYEFRTVHMYVDIENDYTPDFGVFTPQRSASFTITLESSYVPETPTKTGYTFTGWYLDEDCTIPYEEDTFTSDMVLYAGFRPNSYSVVFHANNGTDEQWSQTFFYDTAQNLDSNHFEKTGYEFLGWSTQPNGTSATYTDGQSVKNLTMHDGGQFHLYAVWKASKYYVVFVGTTGSYTMTCTIDQTHSVYDGSTLTKEGHTLTGYSIAENGPLGYVLGSTFKNLAQPGETVYLYACYEPIPVYITFVVDGKVIGSVTVDWGTPTTDVISQNVDSLLLEVEDGQELPN